MIGIYKITSPSKKVYIGQSIDIENRFNNYKKKRCKGQTILYNSLLKYGFDKHKFEVLCECNVEELNNKERYYQDIFNAVGVNGMNCRLTIANDRSGILSEETKKKMSESKKGRKLSKEHIKSMSDVRKGIPKSIDNIKNSSEAQRKLILNTQTGIFYYGNKEASESACINALTLNSYLTGRVKNKTNFIYV